MQNAEPPTLEIILWLEPHLEAAIQAVQVQDQLVAALAAAAGSKLNELGLPVVAQCSLRSGMPGEHRAALLALQVNGHTLPSPPGLENRLLAVLHGRLLQPGESGPAIPGWLEQAFVGNAPHTRQAAIQYLAQLSQAILGEHPELLIDEQQVRLLRSLWSPQARGISRQKTAWLAGILGELLAVRLPLVGSPQLFQLLQEHRRLSALEAAETIIAALIPQTIGLRLPRQLLRGYTQEDVRAATPDQASPLAPATATSQSADAFYQMDQQIFADLGLNLPRLEFEVIDESLPSFDFRLNGMLSPPYPALPPGKVLVDAPPTTLENMSIPAQAVLHPLDGRLCSLVERGDDAPPTEKGYYTWNGLEYLALCLGHALRRHPGCLVHSLALSVWQEEIERGAPELVKAVQISFPEGYARATLVRTLRLLVQQGVSMVELPRILETLLRPTLLEVPSPDWTVIGNAMPAAARLAQSEWRTDPAGLAAYARWNLEVPAVSLSPAERSPAGSPPQIIGLEQYAEPLTQDERMAELARRYTNEDIQHYLSQVAVALVIMQEPDLPEFVNEKIEELFSKLGILADTPADEMLAKIMGYFNENPVNPQLVQDSTAAIRAEVPANADAFTTRWRTKYTS